MVSTIYRTCCKKVEQHGRLREEWGTLVNQGRQLAGEEDQLVRRVEVEAAVGLPQLRHSDRPLQ